MLNQPHETIFTITFVARIFLLESAGLGISSYCKCKEIEMQTHSTPAVGSRDPGIITHSTHAPLCTILGLPGNSLSIRLPGNSLSIANVMKVALLVATQLSGFSICGLSSDGPIFSQSPSFPLLNEPHFLELLTSGALSIKEGRAEAWK